VSLDAQLAMAQRRVLAAAWSAPETFRDQVQRLAELVHLVEQACSSTPAPGGAP
jgi:hypothetical protein